VGRRRSVWARGVRGSHAGKVAVALALKVGLDVGGLGAFAVTREVLSLTVTVAIKVKAKVSVAARA
jgi:hypothetical protein